MMTKTVENDRNCKVAEERIVSKLSRYRSEILIIQIEDWKEGYIQISRLHLIYFLINKSSNSVTIGSSQFIVLNNLDSPKMVIKMYLHFLRSL